MPCTAPVTWTLGMLWILLILGGLWNIASPSYGGEREYFATKEKASVKFLNKHETYALTGDTSSIEFSDGHKSVIVRTLTKVDEFIATYYASVVEELNAPWTFALIDSYSTDTTPFVKDGVIILYTYSLEWNMTDKCQIHLDLLYLRLEQLHAIPAKPMHGLNVPPWRARDRKWTKADLIPTCNYFLK
jgi:outer membrane protein assembly factor BamB